MTGMEPVVAAALIGSATTVMSAAMAPEPAAAPAPTAAPVKPMPSADSEAVRAAKKKAASRQLGRGGRASTIMTEPSEKLGG